MVWFNNTVYPSDYYGPTGPEASQSTAFTFQRLCVLRTVIHSGTVVGKLEGDRAITLGFVDLMRDESIQQDLNRGVSAAGPSYT